MNNRGTSRTLQLSAHEIEALPKNLPQARALVAECDRLQHTAKSQRGLLVQQGNEIKRLRRQVSGAQRIIHQDSRTNARLAKDLIDAWEFIWRIAGGALVGGNARHAARNHQLKAKTTEADRAQQ